MSKHKDDDDLLYHQCVAWTDSYQVANGVVYGQIQVNGKWLTIPIGSSEFVELLKVNFFKEYGLKTSKRDIDELILMLKADAISRGVIRKLVPRYQFFNNRTYIQIDNGGRSIYKVTSKKWKRVANKKFHFMQRSDLADLPNISRKGENTGDISLLLEYLPEGYDKLIISYIIFSMLGFSPHMILVVTGVEGSGKSFLLYLLKRIIDPSINNNPINLVSRNEIIDSANNEYLVTMNNVTKVSKRQSELLCTIPTEGNFSSANNFMESSTKPLVMSGIHDFIEQPDLSQRCIFVTLPDRSSYPYLHTLKGKIEEDIESIYISLLEALPSAIKMIIKSKCPDGDRFNAFLKIGKSLEDHFGWEKGEFLSQYNDMIMCRNMYQYDCSSTAQAIYKFMNNRRSWSGNAKDLLYELDKLELEEPAIPKTISHRHISLGKKITTVINLLRNFGIVIKRARSKDRIITISKNDKYNEVEIS